MKKRSFVNKYRARRLLNTNLPVELKPNLLKKSIFIHIPKTGGTFFREHFNEQIGWFEMLGEGHGNMEDFNLFSDRFSFTFIRHPEKWLISYWNFFQIVMQQHNLFEWQAELAEQAVRENIKWTRWHDKGNPIEVLWHEDIDVFLERILNHAPNVVDLCFRHFTYNVDFIGKTETLVNDILFALELAGEDLSFYQSDIILGWSEDKRNVHPVADGFRFNSSLMNEIMDKNPLICSHY
jgi:hypothetical protein